MVITFPVAVLGAVALAVMLAEPDCVMKMLPLVLPAVAEIDVPAVRRGLLEVPMLPVAARPEIVIVVPVRVPVVLTAPSVMAVTALPLIVMVPPVVTLPSKSIEVGPAPEMINASALVPTLIPLKVSEPLPVLLKVIPVKPEAVPETVWVPPPLHPLTPVPSVMFSAESVRVYVLPASVRVRLLLVLAVVVA